MACRIIQGEVREVLPTLDAGSVQCCVTSPPYWGLRDYGTASWSGGDPACAHRVGGQVQDSKAPGAIVSGVRPGADASICQSCGARRVDAQLGLERTPEEYVEQMVGVFREVRRVLADDGTLWLNLGDSYSSNQSNNGGYSAKSTLQGFTSPNTKGRRAAGRGGAAPLWSGLKPKDLVGIPWRVAFALQADGWWLRQDIIWAKPNPMPESVTDRCTKAHEYLFLLSKAARYYYDAEAIAEPSIHAGSVVKNDNGKNADMGRFGQTRTGFLGEVVVTETRNRRSVWTVATQPFPEAHFATFPEDLVSPCILAGCPPGGTVLDPFGGSGTVGAVAQRLGRNAVLVELNPEYVGIASRRTAQTGLLLT